jgi:hypothetical protein
MPVATPRLELRFHVAAQMGLRPHQPALVVLGAHEALRVIQAGEAVGHEGRAVLQVRQGDDDGRAGLRLEAHLAVPRHVLDGQQRAVGQHDHVQVAVGHQHAVRRLDDLREHVLDRVQRHVAVLLRPAVANEHGLCAALRPVDVQGRVYGELHVCAVEVDGLSGVGERDVRGEAERVRGNRTLGGDFVYVRAGVDGEPSIDGYVEYITEQLGRAAVVEKCGGLQSRRREGQVFLPVLRIATGLVKFFHLSEECGVEAKNIVVLLHKRVRRDLSLDIVT